MKHSVSVGQRIITDETRAQTLQQTTTKWTLGAALVGLSLYAAIEYLVVKPESLPSFLLHHMMDVSLVVLLVWFACNLVIRQFVIEPVSRVFIHLKRMAGGRIDYIRGEMKSREIVEVATSINQLVAKLSATRDERSVSEGLDSLRQLRMDLNAVTDDLGERSVPVMRSLSKLEASLLHLLPNVDTEPSACCRHSGSDCKPL